MTRKRNLVNELSNEPGRAVFVEPEAAPLWATKHTRLQLVRAIQIRGDQFVGVQGCSELWLYPKGSPDCGHGYVVSDDHRGLTIQLCAPGGAHTQLAFIGFGNVAGITERDAK